MIIEEACVIGALYEECFQRMLFAKDREKKSNERDKKEKERVSRVRRKANKIHLRRVSSFCSFFLIILTLLYA